MTTKIQSSPLTRNTTYKRLIFNYFKELLTRFYGTAMNVAYIAGKSVDKNKLKETLVNLKKLVTIVPIGDSCIEQALNGDLADFEDSLQCFAAQREQVNFILSRDEKGFKNSEIPVMNVAEFLNSFVL